ncbi:hypothetical protein Mpet_2659 [Methanolacinia petrolearia DSM 11571]|uniref:Uncharacterized protein n=1 Tax=Methanolacinia petrolearia (strain DSM 11571 / OCM 486 / SEBR 4847) TaxID=679926 RepID=E1RG88_METP4|nr:hypothetical protein [Methanolacinia petrolearia]ADN37402.1 hypothetical protein Mpet_2659 [Methanolacinia petrolearia DSM 11571]
MNWLVYLSGDDHLMDIISRSAPELLICPGSDGRYAFFYDSSGDFSTAEDVSSDAGNKIELIRGVSMLIFNDDPKIKAEDVSLTRQKRKDFLNEVPFGEEGNFIISCEDGDDEEIQIRSPFESVFLVAAADSDLGEAISEIPRAFGTWDGFLKLYRMIESSAGNPVAKGWCSDDELGWFLYSAGRLSSGESCDGNESAVLMYLSEAESFLTILLQEWIKEKKRELDI